MTEVFLIDGDAADSHLARLYPRLSTSPEVPSSDPPARCAAMGKGLG